MRADAAASMRVRALPLGDGVGQRQRPHGLRDGDAGAVEPGQRAEPRYPEIPARRKQRPHEPFGCGGIPATEIAHAESSRSSLRPSPAASAAPVHAWEAWA